MKNKKTVLIFANDNSGEFAGAIKERLASFKNVLCIIIGENEFRSTGSQIAKDLLLNPDGVILRTARRIINGGEDRNIDKIPSADITYKAGSVSHIKMRNVFARYNPDLAVLMSGALSSEVLSVRAKFAPQTKVFMLVKDFAVHCGIINPHIDKYFVENMVVLTMLANVGIKQKDIALTNLPVRAVFDAFVDKKEAASALSLAPDKPTVMFAFSGKTADSADKKALNELKEFARGCNILAACDQDRNLLEHASALGYKAYNEGGNLNLMYSAADLVVTRACAKTVTEALYKQKLAVIIPSSNKLEQRSLKGLSGLTIDATPKGGLVSFLDDFMRTEGFRDTYQNIIEEAAARLIRPEAGIFLDSIISALEIK